MEKNIFPIRRTSLTLNKKKKKKKFKKLQKELLKLEMAKYNSGYDYSDFISYVKPKKKKKNHDLKSRLIEAASRLAVQFLERLANKFLDFFFSPRKLSI